MSVSERFVVSLKYQLRRVNSKIFQEYLQKIRLPYKKSHTYQHTSSIESKRQIVEAYRNSLFIINGPRGISIAKVPKMAPHLATHFHGDQIKKISK